MYDFIIIDNYVDIIDGWNYLMNFDNLHGYLIFMLYIMLYDVNNMLFFIHILYGVKFICLLYLYGILHPYVLFVFIFNLNAKINHYFFIVKLLVN